MVSPCQLEVLDIRPQFHDRYPFLSFEAALFESAFHSEAPQYSLILKLDGGSFDRAVTM